MTTPRPTDKELLWREERDQYGNSTFEALSYTWGNAENQPTLTWVVQCVLKNNAAVWTVDDTSHELLDSQPVRKEADPATAIFDTAEDAQKWCQWFENELRAMLGEGLPPAPEPEPEAAPLIGDEHGYAPTTRVNAHWSRNGGRLHFTRIWAKVDAPTITQTREITDPEEERQCFRNYFRQVLIEDAVTRLVTGGFGRLLIETPFATALMQCELEMHSVSTMQVTIRRQGAKPEVLEIPAPTMEQFMRVVAKQMHARQAELAAKVGNKTELELHAEIARAARALGLDYTPPSPDQVAEDGPAVLPVELEDIQAGGGDITRPGHVPGANGGRRP